MSKNVAKSEIFKFLLLSNQQSETQTLFTFKNDKAAYIMEAGTCKSIFQIFFFYSIVIGGNLFSLDHLID